MAFTFNWAGVNTPQIQGGSRNYQQTIRSDAQAAGNLVRGYEQRKAALEGLKDIEGLSVVPNKGAMYIFPRLDSRFNILNDKNFAMDLLHEKNILVIPGSGFDWPYPDHFRLVLLPSVEETTQAMADIKDFLKTYRQI